MTTPTSAARTNGFVRSATRPSRPADLAAVESFSTRTACRAAALLALRLARGWRAIAQFFGATDAALHRPSASDSLSPRDAQPTRRVRVVVRSRAPPPPRAERAGRSLDELQVTLFPAHWRVNRGPGSFAAPSRRFLELRRSRFRARKSSSRAAPADTPHQVRYHSAPYCGRDADGVPGGEGELQLRPDPKSSCRL